jgi:6-pyruvoyltetrahydropterin/6-carboxytetrahydropterin synthase
MFTVTKHIEFCYGHRLLAYDGPCRHLHGHNGLVEVQLVSAHLDRRGMVVDFSDIKRVIKGWIDENLDHRMLLHQDDPMLPTFQKLGEKHFVMTENPTAENIAKLIFDYARSQDLPVTRVRLWETPSSHATFERRPGE